jgi:hypothetical protein
MEGGVTPREGSQAPWEGIPGARAPLQEGTQFLCPQNAPGIWRGLGFILGALCCVRWCCVFPGLGFHARIPLPHRSSLGHWQHLANLVGRSHSTAPGSVTLLWKPGPALCARVSTDWASGSRPKLLRFGSSWSPEP